MPKAKRKPKKGKRTKGINCPHCGLKLYQGRTVPRADGSIQRKRKCRECGFTKKTFER